MNRIHLLSGTRNRSRVILQHAAAGLLACAGLATFSCSRTLMAEDDLISEIRSGSVYSSEKSTDSESEYGTSKEAGKGKRITDPETLRLRLTDAGFEATVEGSRTVVTKKLLEDVSYPVRVSISEDEFQVGISVGLATLANSQPASSEQLLLLMEAGLTHAPAQFVHDRERGWLDLHVALKNSGLTGQSLRDEINRMIRLARDTHDLWSFLEQPASQLVSVSKTTDGTAVKDEKAADSESGESASGGSAAPETKAPEASGQQGPASSSAPVKAEDSTSANPAQATQTPATPPAATAAPAAPAAPASGNTAGSSATPAAPTQSAAPVQSGTETSGRSSGTATTGISQALTGRWAGSRSKSEAFAIEFGADGTFRLAFVSGTKKTTSTGRFTLNADRLTLTGTDSLTLAGTMTSSSDTEFQFTPESGKRKDATLVFRKVK